MGSHLFSARRMSDQLDADSDPLSRDSDNERDIATILQFLITSGQVRIFPSVPVSSDNVIYQEDLENELFSSGTPSKDANVENSPDTSRIAESDVSHNIKVCSGFYNDASSKNSIGLDKSLPALLSMREIGMNGRQQFSRGDRCQIFQRYLPNKMTPIEDFNCKVFCGTYAKDGDLFMTASQDYFVRIYNTSKGAFDLIKTVIARDVGWSILDTAVSPDGRHFVYCSWSECIHICNIYGDYETHDALPLFPEERRFCLFSLKFSHDGCEILGGANDECLYVYNREQNQRTLRIHAHEDDVNSVAFADSTSQILYSGGDDGLCKVWDRRMLSESSPKPVGVLVGHADGITYVDGKGDGRHLITNSKDQSIKLWDMRMFSPNSTVCATKKSLNTRWDYRWQRVPSNLNKPRRRLVGDTSLMTYRGHSVLQTLIRCHFSPEATTGQQYIYTGCAQGRVVIYNVLTGKIETTLNAHRSCVRDVAWHPYKNEIISSSWDGVLGKWTYSGKLEMDSDSESDRDSDSSGYGKYNKQGVVKLRRSVRLASLRRRRENDDGR